MTTKIEWTDATWNPVTGCTKVSAGCKNCYAERLAPKVFAGQKVFYSGPGSESRPRIFTDVLMHPSRLDAPLHWKKPRRVFVNSMSDLFHEDVPDEFIDTVFAVMCKCCRRFDNQDLYAHTFQILTKRAERMQRYMADPKRTERVFIACDKTPLCGRASPPPWPLPNVWLGVSVEDQSTADERIPLLLQTPAAVRFLSCEPLLGPIDLTDVGQDRDGYGFTVNALTGEPDAPKCIGALMSHSAISWVIAGGESGRKARPSHPDWFRSLRDQCAAVGVPFFFKQWGEWQIASAENGHYDCDMARNKAHWVHSDGVVTKPSCLREGVPDEVVNQAFAMVLVGKKTAGRTLDGRIHDEWPA